jgi:hypothetical protein
MHFKHISKSQNISIENGSNMRNGFYYISIWIIL